jgi:hypothetical protein
MLSQSGSFTHWYDLNRRVNFAHYGRKLSTCPYSAYFNIHRYVMLYLMISGTYLYPVAE